VRQEVDSSDEAMRNNSNSNNQISIAPYASYRGATVRLRILRTVTNNDHLLEQFGS